MRLFPPQWSFRGGWYYGVPPLVEFAPLLCEAAPERTIKDSDTDTEVNLNPGNELRKDEPDINHLHVSRAGQGRWHADEQGGQDQESGQVHRHDRFEEELLEEVGCVHDAEHQDGWQVDCEDRVHDSPTKHKHHGDASGRIAFLAKSLPHIQTLKVYQDNRSREGFISKDNNPI